MVQLGVTKDHPNILDQIHLNLEDEKDYDTNDLTFKDPIKDIVFDHEFVVQEIAKYDLSFDGCSNCNQVMRHFEDMRSMTDAIAQREISWCKFPEAIMTCPHPELRTKVTDPMNMHLPPVTMRPRGYIQVKRQAEPLHDNREFLSMARRQTLSILK